MAEGSNIVFTHRALPHFGIQCDWEDALRRPGGTTWVTIRRIGEDTSIHGTLKHERENDGNGNSVSSSEPFTTTKGTSANVLNVKDAISNYECSFIAPSSTFNQIHKKGVISLDVSEGGLGISVCQNNQVNVWETDTGVIRRTLAGHVGDIYSCRLFPSGIVALTAGADMRLKIWSVETGECPVTLIGHTAGILDTCIVDRGRNVISVSKDGTARLWDCGEAKILETLVDCGAAINSCALLSPSSAVNLGEDTSAKSDREIGTTGKLVILAREDCTVQGIGVGSRKSVFTTQLPSPANAVVGTGPNTFSVGCQGGEIATFDMRKIAPPKQIQYATHSPILNLLTHPRSPSSNPTTDESNKLFWVAKNDGTVALINPNLEVDAKRIVQLTGSDFDPIYQMKHDGTYIYTACRDGLIRKYSVNQVTKMLSDLNL